MRAWAASRRWKGCTTGLGVVVVAMVLCGCGELSGQAARDADADVGTRADAADVDSGGEPACECFVGESCPGHDGACQTPKLLFADIVQGLGEGVPQLLVCALAAGGLGGTIVAEEGRCRLTENGPLNIDDATAIGDITVAGDNVGTTTHPVLSLCPVTEPLTFTGAMQAGEAITLSAGATMDVRAFSITAAAPTPALDVVIPASAAVGDAIGVSWTPVAARYFTVTIVAGSLFLRCQPDGDSGAFTIPARLTAMLPAASAQVIYGATNKEYIYTEEGIAVTLRAIMRGFATLELTAQ